MRDGSACPRGGAIIKHNRISSAVILSFFLFILGACSSGGHEVIQIKDKSFADKVLIQKVVNSFPIGEDAQQITDKEKIIKLLTMVEGLEVKELENESLSEFLKSSQGVYMFAFFNKEEKGEVIIKGSYGFHVLVDGTFIFTHKGEYDPQEPLITIDKHKQLLEDIKQLLNINY